MSGRTWRDPETPPPPVVQHNPQAPFGAHPLTKRLSPRGLPIPACNASPPGGGPQAGLQLPACNAPRRAPPRSQPAAALHAGSCSPPPHHHHPRQPLRRGETGRTEPRYLSGGQGRLPSFPMPMFWHTATMELSERTMTPAASLPRPRRTPERVSAQRRGGAGRGGSARGGGAGAAGGSSALGRAEAPPPRPRPSPAVASGEEGGAGARGRGPPSPCRGGGGGGKAEAAGGSSWC